MPHPIPSRVRARGRRLFQRSPSTAPGLDAPERAVVTDRTYATRRETAVELFVTGGTSTLDALIVVDDVRPHFHLTLSASWSSITSPIRDDCNSILCRSTPDATRTHVDRRPYGPVATVIRSWTTGNTSWPFGDQCSFAMRPQRDIWHNHIRSSPTAHQRGVRRARPKRRCSAPPYLFCKCAVAKG